jgi:hypothetical protein
MKFFFQFYVPHKMFLHNPEDVFVYSQGYMYPRLKTTAVMYIVSGTTLVVSVHFQYPKFLQENWF